MEAKSIEHPVVIVTGSSSGIGKALCERLLEAGEHVVGLSRREVESTPHYTHRTMDFADIAALPRRLRALEKELRHVKAIVCNAGRGQFGSLEEFSFEQIRSLVDLNFVSQACLVRAFLPQMKKRGDGRFVFVASEAALWGGRRGAVYCASKAASREFAHALRDEVSRSGIHVSVVNPGLVRTGFFEGAPFEPGPEEEHALLPEEVAEAIARVLSTRHGALIDEVHLSPLKKVLRFRRDREH